MAVEGSISLRGQSLTIGPNGRVRANIEARNVIVHGRVDGNIIASDRVDLRKSASLTGDISTARVAIEDGAFFKGSIDIQKAEPRAKVEPKPPAVVTAPDVPASGANRARLAARAQEVLATRCLRVGGTPRWRPAFVVPSDSSAPECPESRRGIGARNCPYNGAQWRPACSTGFSAALASEDSDGQSCVRRARAAPLDRLQRVHQVAGAGRGLERP